jgi:glycosyltransferase involved in cell wall biosynthesis
MPRFSSLEIVMVSKNNIDDFRKSFQGIKDLLSSNFRGIVVDSSTTSEIAEEANRLIDSGENILYAWEEPQGIYHAMNTGISLCKDGSLVWFLNPGDRLTNPSLIFELVNLIESSDSIWGYGLASYDKGSLTSPRLFPRILENNIQTLFSGELQISHQSMLVSKEVLIDLGMFDSRFQIAADFDFQLKLLAQYSPQILAKHMIIVDTTGVSHSQQIRTLFESFIIRLKQKEFSTLKASYWLIFTVANRIKSSRRLRLHRAN